MVVGTHTHVPTADARILPGGTAFMTDAGMCGPHASIIGRAPEGVLRHMTTGIHSPYEVGRGGEAMCGVVVGIDPGSGRALQVKAVRYEADHKSPPFA
jgi:calcineurin-like phosphoesterase